MNCKLIMVAVFAALSSVALSSDEEISGPDSVVDINEGHEVVRALIWNPEIAERLNQEYLHFVGRMTRQELEPGITRYVIGVSSCGNCQPRKGTVEIIEDMRPTYADGPIDYDVSIKIED